MRAIRTGFQKGYGDAETASEDAYLMSTVEGWRGELPPAIFCHGYGQLTADTAVNSTAHALLRPLAETHMVIAPDLAGHQWGNDTHISRIASAYDYLANTFYGGERRPVVLIAVSMGTLGALNFARAATLAGFAPVAAVAAVIPAVDIADAPLRIGPAPINLAYPPAYDNAVHGPDYNPVVWASENEIPDLPIGLWVSSNDPITPPHTAEAFVAARPQTHHEVFGAYGHNSVHIAAPAMHEWLRDALRE